MMEIIQRHRKKKRWAASYRPLAYGMGLDVRQAELGGGGIWQTRVEDKAVRGEGGGGGRMERERELRWTSRHPINKTAVRFT